SQQASQTGAQDAIRYSNVPSHLLRRTRTAEPYLHCHPRPSANASRAEKGATADFSLPFEIVHVIERTAPAAEARRRFDRFVNEGVSARDRTVKRHSFRQTTGDCG